MTEIKLLQMLTQSTQFQSLTTEQKEIFAKLADAFEDNDLALYLTPTELTEKLRTGNPTLWQSFLQLEPVKAYIKGQLAFVTQVAQRKALQGLATEAANGNTQAARQIAELSGVLSGDSNRTVVLHFVPRSEVKKNEEQV